MVQLMPVDEAQVQALEEELSNSWFNSTENFIQMYNSPYVNKSAEEVIELARRVEASFKNVKLQNKTLVFISETEVQLKELKLAVEAWEMMLKLQAEVEKLKTEDKVQDDTMLYLSPEGLVTGPDHADDAHILVKERLFKAQDTDLADFAHGKFSSSDVKNAFVVKDFLTLAKDNVASAHSALV